MIPFDQVVFMFSVTISFIVGYNFGHRDGKKAEVSR